MSNNHKYNVSHKSKRIYNGETYDSKKEMQYAAHLDHLRKAKKDTDRVVEVSRQIPFSILINDILICKYVLDFQVTYADGRIEYVDVKGMKTPVYNLKKKLMLASNQIKIKEV